MKSEGQRKEGVDRKEGIGGEQQGSTGERGTNESR